MLENILELLHYGTTLVFGIYLSAAFLGVRMSRRNVWILFGFSVFAGSLNTISFIGLGVDMTEKIYPLIIHLPLTLFLTLFYRYRVVAAALSVVISYLCCQISNWVGLFFKSVFYEDWIYYGVRNVVTVVTFVLLLRFVSKQIAQLMQKSVNDILVLGLLPFVYYVYDYVVTVYTEQLYAGGKVITEFLAFVLCAFYVLFLLIYIRQYEEKMEVQHRNQLMEMQCVQAGKEVEMMKRSEYEVSILRHDMRHYLNDISDLVENGENERAQAYISEIVAAADRSAVKKFCSNKLVNMILSSYEKTIEELGVAFQYEISIPEELVYSDRDFSTILSNGLENAIHAVEKLEKEYRKIILDLYMSNNKLLLSIKNTYGEKPKFVDGLPQTKERGHGIGTQSIRFVTEKLNGNCQFSVDDDYFILRIIL